MVADTGYLTTEDEEFFESCDDGWWWMLTGTVYVYVAVDTIRAYVMNYSLSARNNVW